MPHPDVQRARVNIRWKRVRAEQEQEQQAATANAKAKGKLTQQQFDALMASLAKGYDIWRAGLDAAGLHGAVENPERTLRRQKDRASGGDSEPAAQRVQGYISTPTTSEIMPRSIWDRAQRRLEAEGGDAPDGYWARKTRLYQAALEECVEDCDTPALKARQILTLISMFHAMKDVYLRKGEKAKRIAAEEEDEMEAAIANMSDEELLKLERGEKE